MSKDDQKIGTYMHALQDSFSHAGYGPLLGHVTPAITATLFSRTSFFPFSTIRGLKAAYDVDNTAARPGVAMQAAKASYEALSNLHGGSATFAFSVIEGLVDAYLRAEEHTAAQKFYKDRLCETVGCTKTGREFQ